MHLDVIIVLVVGYLLGSIPSGYILAKLWRGIDIRQYGSGNIGATNIYRTLGVAPGILVLLADMAKGIAAVLAARYIASGDIQAIAELSAAVGALLGHSASIFLKFKGGKIVATGGGIIFVISPLTGLIALVLLIATVAITRYVSAGSMVAALSIPIAFYLLNLDLPYLIFGIAVAALVIYKHRSNIKRIFSGTEYKIGQKPK
ncbi:glycerol-3-phosphate 1-O-acyltransferase PlsY [Peptococcaceae bacterium 1198_IL3148]